MTDNKQIIFLQNYYYHIDPQDYYKNDKNEIISLGSKRSEPYLPVYVSDLIDQNECNIYIDHYRNEDDNSSTRIKKFRTGVVHSYNPKTKLLEVISEKNYPFIKRFNKKMRYVEPESAKLNLSRDCFITKTDCNQKPECLKQLNDLNEKYTQQQNLKNCRSLIKKHKGTGRRSKRNSFLKNHV